MLSMRQYSVVLVVAMWTFSCAGSSMDQAMKQAKDEDKGLVVEFFATWCGPCKYFEAKVLKDPDVQASLKSFVFRRIDFDSTAGKHHAKRLGVNAVPSVVYVDQEGNAHGRLRGAASKSTFLDFLGWVEVERNKNSSVKTAESEI